MSLFDRLLPRGPVHILGQSEPEGTSSGSDRVEEAVPLVTLHLNGPEYGAAQDEQSSETFSNWMPGVYATAYLYEDQEGLNYLAGRGWESVKVPLRWERIQPNLLAPLDVAELRQLREFLDRCLVAGLKVVLDIHNYGIYFLHRGRQGVGMAIGSREVPVEAFADLWRRLAREFREHPAVIGYALCAEPQGSAGLTLEVWQQASQAAVTAIREEDRYSEIHVPGWDWSSVARWSANGGPWVRDDAPGRTRFMGHHYWDSDGSGKYERSYDDEVRAAQSKGWRARGHRDALHTKVLGELEAFVGWAQRHRVRVLIGELGWPWKQDSGKWNELGRVYLERCVDLDVPLTVWAAGAWADGLELLVYQGSPISALTPTAPVVEKLLDPGTFSRNGVARVPDTGERDDLEE